MIARVVNIPSQNVMLSEEELSGKNQGCFAVVVYGIGETEEVL